MKTIVKLAITAGAVAAIAAGDPLPPRDWLLVRQGGFCIVRSETHPSTQAQMSVCGWVASKAVCEGRRREDREWACQEVLDELLGK